jgi:hypothetical protein
MIKYTTKEGMFETDNPQDVPIKELHSLNDNPALILDKHYSYLETLLFKPGLYWYKEGKEYRENGPCFIDTNNKTWFNIECEQKFTRNVNDWLENHPNKNLTFQAMMRLKYS